MNPFKISSVLFLVLSLTVFFSREVTAYPKLEKTQLSVSGVTAQAVQMVLTSDNRYLYLGFNNKVKVVDLGSFDLRSSTDQPFDFGADTDLNGIVGGLTLSTSRLYVSKDDGEILLFDLSDLDAEPSVVTIKSNTTLGKAAITSDGSKIYIVDEDNEDLFVYTVGSGTVATISISPSVVGASITDMELVPTLAGGSDVIYLTTDKGRMFYLIDGSSTATEVAVGDATDTLTGITARANEDFIYVVNVTDKSLLVLSPTNLSTVATVPLKIDSDSNGDTYNESLTDVVSADVSNPSAIYTFVSGLSGISVLDENHSLVDIDTSSGSIDFNPITISGSRYGPMVASSDGYIYMSNADGSLSVITEKPFVTISGITYPTGKSSISTGESATITFQSDEAGTYEVRVGGDITQNGTKVNDTSGSSSGSITASTDTTFTFNYDDNSSALSEGSNTIFVFVTDSDSTVGRDAVTLSVDTPPPAVTVESSSFGNSRIYLNLTRLTTSDISYYNVYVSQNADEVANKQVSATRISQPSSGATISAEISGLDNGTLYYASVEAVDSAGNIGPLTTTFAGGGLITATPEATLGPAELTGEKGGCSLLVKEAAEKPESKWWSTEVKGYFWLPLDSAMKRFFDPCCHLGAFVEQGFLYDSKYGVEVGVGFLNENGRAVGATSGAASQDTFSLFLLPTLINLVFRADFAEEQMIVPYVKAGPDFVYFRENLKGAKTQGLKTGLHMAGGLQILLDKLDSGGDWAMSDIGIDDLYLTLEGRYNWIDGFGGKGLDLSSLIFSFGLLFEY